MATKFFKIFKVGTFTAMAGQTLSFSDQDIRDMATYYRLGRKFAPLVLGHPASNGPSLGTVLDLHDKGGALFAEADVSDELVNLVRAGSYTKVSASFFAKLSPNNPMPGAWSLRHVGFLGACAPAVKGLGALGFSESVGGENYNASAVDASFVDLRGRGCEVSFSEYQGPMTDYQRGREQLHRAALRTVAANPEFSYIEAVRMFERNF